MSRMKQKYLYWGLPVFGILFTLWYVKTATYDMPYSDYIRIINSYLPDVWNPDKFLVPDILTRIPLNFLARGINVTFFHYSVTFDLILGVLGLGSGALILGVYSEKHQLGLPWFLLLMVIYFSLNKWEMLTNGTGWIHFLAFGCFYYHYLVFDRVEAGKGKKGDVLRLWILPFLITLGVAGPYCAIYSAVLLLAYAACMLHHAGKNGKLMRQYAVALICVLIPLLLYLWSNSYAVEVHAGAVTDPLLPTLFANPVFFLKFFIKSFSSMVLTHGMAEKLVGSGWILSVVTYGLGLVVIGAYLLALWLNVRYGLYKKTLLPLLLILAGGMNHVLIVLSRWIFLDVNYGMSSRYALQFQVGILGIILTVGLLWKEISNGLMRILALFLCMLFLAGNGYSTYWELQTAPYREAFGERIAGMALNYEKINDAELKKEFQYRSADKIRHAMDILRENQWSIFRNTEN